MALWRQLRRGLHALTHRAATDEEIADEVAHFLDEATVAHQARGLSPAEARRAARLEMGSPLAVREAVREWGWENAVESLWSDLRQAARRLRAEPGFTSIAVLTLALGLGGTTAMVGTVGPILFEPLPYPEPRRIVAIWEVARDGGHLETSFGMGRELAARSRDLAAFALYKPWQPALTGGDRPERLEGQRVGADFFRVLAVPPALGRAFRTAEDRADGGNVAVLSHGLWQRRFGADPAILGRSVSLDGEPTTVVGVMPPGFSSAVAPAAEVWAPLQYDLAQGRAWGHHLRAIGRLSAGTSSNAAGRELGELGRAVLAEQHPPTYANEVAFQVTPLREDLTGPARPLLLALLGAVALVLAIACVNVTNLLLARDARRQGELALRAALGAGHTRLLRQQLTESLLLAALGGLAGVGVAQLLVRALVALSPADLPRLAAVTVGGRALATGLAITVLAGLACGLGPALGASRHRHPRSLEAVGRRTTGGGQRALRTLVVVQVALALVLLVGSGLLLKSLDRLLAVDAGFRAPGLLSLQISTTGEQLDDEARRQLYARVLAAVEAVPGVSSAALTSQLPLSGDLDQYGVHFEPAASADPGEERGSFRYAVSPGYLATLGLPLRRGRWLAESDRDGAAPVVVISESMARRRLPGLDPLGRQLRIGTGPLSTVVGVVGDVRQLSLADPAADAAYVTLEQWTFSDRVLSLVVRGPGDAAALATAVRQAVWSVDRSLPLVRMRTLDELLRASTADRRFALAVFAAFALTALLLAAAGIYGVLAGAVAERQREIGVRGALGADRGRILGLVLGRGLALTARGVAAGTAVALLATAGLEALLFGVSRFDLGTYLAVIALLTGVAVLACAVPAWRALRVDPASALRAG